MSTPIDTDQFNKAQDLVRAVIALNSGARFDGARTVNFHGVTLSCERRGPELIWRVGRDFMSPIYWPAHFKVRATHEQHATIRRIASRPL